MLCYSRFFLFFFLISLVSCGSVYHSLPKPLDSSSSSFQVRPYIQNPATNAVTLIWFSRKNSAANILIRAASGEIMQTLVSSPARAEHLAYSPLEVDDLAVGQTAEIPYQHQLRITDLAASSSYSYQITQGVETVTGDFRTAGDKNSPVRIIVYADSETEPESTGKYSAWPVPGQLSSDRRYLVDQTTGYRENLSVIAKRRPDFIAIAGDLVQSGGEQRDWDEFWRHNESIAAGIPIFPALGNHEYYAGPDDFGAWAIADSERSVRKYKTYFDLPDNHAANTDHHERYYAVEYGPVTLIVLDPTNGFPDQTSSDTNWSLKGEKEGGVAPGWAAGSEQYRWLENQLSIAQRNSRFTFVMFHYCPYTSGVHGLPPGPDSDVTNNTSALPLQALTPLFMQYGVDLMLNGHDEMAEHSVVPGSRINSEGNRVDHFLHVYDTGVGGDGLRGPQAGISNPYQVFIAHDDSPEVYNDKGVLLDGGKHYGHLEINVSPNKHGLWQVSLDFIYVFPVTNSLGDVLRFERRIYKDSVVFPVKWTTHN